MVPAEGQDLSVVVRWAASGELLAKLRVKRTDTVAHLCEAALREAGRRKAGHASLAVLGTRKLEPHATLAGAGVSDGDEVGIVNVPLGCLTVSVRGVVQTWHLQNKGSCPVPVASLQVGPDLKLAACSPKCSTVAAVDCSGRGSLWCVDTGERIANLGDDLKSCSFSSDGLHLLAARDNGTACIWDASSGKCVQVLVGHGGSVDVRLAAFSPDAALAATGASDGAVCLFEAATGRRLRTVRGHTQDIMALEFSRDGQFVVTGSLDATARVWRVSTGKCVQVLHGHTKAVRSASFSPCGRQVLTSSFDGTARIWDLASGKSSVSLAAEKSVVSSAAFSPDGATVVLAQGSPSVRQYSQATGECLHNMTGHEDWVRSATFSPDGSLLATASFDGTARIFCAASGECLQTLEGGVGDVLLARVMSLCD